MRPLLIGGWVAVLALGACYAAASYALGGGVNSPGKGDERLIVGLQYKKVPVVNVPVIAEGTVKGYVVANVVFTGDADTMRALPVPVEVFVRDEMFRYLYNDPRFNFEKLSKYDVDGMIAGVRANVNRRLGGDVVREILLESINFLDRASVSGGSASTKERISSNAKNDG